MMKRFFTCCGIVISIVLYGSLFVRAANFREMKPFPIDWEQAAQSAIDLSTFLDGPAGRDGFIRVANGHLVRPDGRRFRIWGVNICGPHCFPPKEQAAAIAADLARYGINCVRFHHTDSTWGNIFGPNRDDTRLDLADAGDTVSCK